jgi:hypothetical protein
MTDERASQLSRLREWNAIEQAEAQREMLRARRMEQEQAEAIKKKDEVMTRAAAELRHAYSALKNGGRIDPGLVERAIQMLERGTS